VQLILNVAITSVVACSGPLGWLTLGAIGLGQMVADTYLGPATSTAATWGNRASTTLGVAVSASEKYLVESSKVQTVAKGAGKVIIVVGFVFDFNEIALGMRNIDALKKLMADVKKAQNKLLLKIKANKATLAALSVKFGQLSKQIEKRGKGWTAQTRETLDEEMRRSGYRPRI